MITSVPQGLGGGSGFQPVLRTAGLRPSIAERLAMRAAYPHPHDFGHPDNPHVLFHRIETIGDRTIHILGSVRDAGSSYTGRSNYLAELIAIDRAETRSLPAGPVFAAQAFPWLDHWSGEPREIPLGEERAVPAEDPDDRNRTGPARICTTWASLAGDAGWAGALAQSFLDGRSAVVWVEKQDDATALFAEAARLLPPSERWSVTFNSCEIEPFPAYWRARRSDLAVVGPRPAAQDLVLDLSMLRKTGQRAPDTELARRARGEQPDHSTTKPRNPTAAVGSRTTADEDALRAHLQEISEERKRRSRTSRTVVGGESPWSTWQTTKALAAAGIILAALLVTFVAVSAGLDPGATSRWMGYRFSDDDSVDHGLRQGESKSVVRKKENSAPNQTNAVPPSEPKERPSDPAETRSRPSPGGQAEDDRDSQPDSAPLPPQDLAAKQAIEELEKYDGEAFPLCGSKRRDPLADDGSVPLTEKPLLHFSDHLLGLAPEFDLPGPYDDEERLKVTRVSGEPRWRIEGGVRDELMDENSSPPKQLLGELIVQNGLLFLKPRVSEEDQLIGRLQNSVLLIRTLDPASPAPTKKLRCRIFFSKPLTSAETRISLDPLLGNDARQFAPHVAARICGVRNAKWEIVLTLSGGDGRSIQAPETAASFLLLPDSQPIVYRGLRGDGKKIAGSRNWQPLSLEKHKVDFQIETSVSFSKDRTAKLQLSAKVIHLEHLPWHARVLKLDVIRNMRDGNGHAIDAVKAALANELRSRLEDEKKQARMGRLPYITALEESPYITALFDEFLRQRHKKWEDTKENPPPEPPKDFADFYRKWETATLERRGYLDALEQEFLQSVSSECVSHAGAVIDSICKNNGCVGPFQAHIRSFHADVVDSEGNKILIPIVAEGSN